MPGEFLTIGETAATLGVSTRHARRLADSGAITRLARGLVDPRSVDRYVGLQRQGRTRAWAEHTAWGAAALLSGLAPDWLGATQASRLKSTLRGITDSGDLLARMRDRVRVHTFTAHRAALPRIADRIDSANLRLLGISDAVDGGVDGYLAAAQLDGLVRTMGLRADPNGAVVLRTTNFDFDRVRKLLTTTTVAALDAATTTDPRMRGVGHRKLGELLDEYR